MSEPKLCKDCKHFTVIIGFELCDHPSVRHSPVDGSPVSSVGFVRDEQIGECGLIGRLFEQKPPPEPDPPSWWARIFRRTKPT